ncbi:MAG: hypothetical protein ABIQ93_11025 [Saprospiraceae bacterium]
MHRTILLFFLQLAWLGAMPAAFASKYFDFSPAVQDAYQKAVSLRLGESQAALALLATSEPDNLMPVYIANYVDFLTVFVNENKAEYNRLSKNMDPRLDKISRGDRRSPYYLYTQAQIRLQWAILRLRFSDYLAGASDIKQAYALLEENQRRFPDFVANKMSLGIMHALVGNVPEDYRWVIRGLGGMSGSTQQGVREMEEVLAYAKNNLFIFEDEAVAAYSFLQLFLNNQGERAWQTLKNSKLTPKTNPLAAYVLATVAMRMAHNDEAIRYLQECPTTAPYYPFPERSYLLGLAKLRRLDTDANGPLQTFLTTSKGANGLKDGYQKLAWYCLLNGNPTGYTNNMDLVKTKGAASDDSDAAALREAKSGERPDLRLLKARLLFDGGYYQRAYDLLKDAGPDYASSHRLDLEYGYRLGRITHRMGKTYDAARWYDQTIERGAADPAYFACNAALQLGLLYEETKDFGQARQAFNRCLALKPEVYATSLHAQAKAGLSRLK